MAGGGRERGRDLGRDLHVKGLSEPHCCSVSPNLHVCTAEAPLCDPSLCKAPCLCLHACPWHRHDRAQVASWAVFPALPWTNWGTFGRALFCSLLEKEGADTPAFLPGHVQTGWRCWGVASSLRQRPGPLQSFTCCTANPGDTETHSQLCLLCLPFRKHFFWLSGVTTVVSTLMSFIKPAFNAYALNCIAFHLLYLTWCELKK